MAQRQTVEVDGIPEFKRKLERLGGEISDALEEAATAGAEIIVEEAQLRAPVLTGKLRDSIESWTLDLDEESVIIAIGSDVDYAHRIELGFVGSDRLGRVYNQPAQPYLRPAFDQELDQAVNEMIATLEDTIRRVTIA